MAQNRVTAGTSAEVIWSSEWGHGGQLALELAFEDGAMGRELVAINIKTLRIGFIKIKFLFNFITRSLFQIAGTRISIFSILDKPRKRHSEMWAFNSVVQAGTLSVNEPPIVNDDGRQVGLGKADLAAGARACATSAAYAVARPDTSAATGFATQVASSNHGFAAIARLAALPATQADKHEH